MNVQYFIGNLFIAIITFSFGSYFNYDPMGLALGWIGGVASMVVMELLSGR